MTAWLDNSGVFDSRHRLPLSRAAQADNGFMPSQHGLRRC